MSEDFYLEIDNLLADNSKPKKKKNSGAKGNRAERQLCERLSERFGLPFERSLGSGNRWSQVRGPMSQAAKDTLLGDISCPDGFKWVLESKSGYEDKVDIHNVWQKGNKTIDSFINQVEKDEERSGRLPLLLYKRNLRPWLAFFREQHRPCQNIEGQLQPYAFEYYLKYRDWMAVDLETLLSIENPKSPEDKDFWFTEATKK